MTTLTILTTFVLTSLAILALAAVCFLSGCASVPAKSQTVSMGATSGGFICPLTGEVLPCPKCCPLNNKQK